MCCLWSPILFPRQSHSPKFWQSAACQTSEHHPATSLLVSSLWGPSPSARGLRISPKPGCRSCQIRPPRAVTQWQFAALPIYPWLTMNGRSRVDLHCVAGSARVTSEAIHSLATNHREPRKAYRERVITFCAPCIAAMDSILYFQNKIKTLHGPSRMGQYYQSGNNITLPKCQVIHISTNLVTVCCNVPPYTMRSRERQRKYITLFHAFDTTGFYMAMG